MTAQRSVLIEEPQDQAFLLGELNELDEQTDFLEEVKLFLTFEDTYLSGHRVLGPQAALEIHAKNSQGKEKRALGREYNVDEDVVALAVKRVDRAAKIVSGDYDDQQFIPRYRHFLNVYHAYKKIPRFLDENKCHQTELGILLEENPHVEEIFRYAGTGRALREYFNDLGLGGAKGINEDPYVKCLQKLFLKGEWDGITLTALSQASLFSKYLRGDHNIGTRMQVSIGRLFANTDVLGIDNPNYYFVPWVKKFLKLGFFVDYHQSKGRENARRLEKFLANPNDPNSADLAAYYRDGFANHEMPYGLKVLMETNVNFQQVELKKLIAQEFFYSYGGLKAPLLYGYRFLENEILIGSPLHSIHPTLDYYNRNRRTENERIMQLIGEGFKTTP